MFISIKRIINKKIQKNPTLSQYINKKTFLENIRTVCKDVFYVETQYIKDAVCKNGVLIIYTAHPSVAQELYFYKDIFLQKYSSLFPYTKKKFHTVRIVNIS